MPSEKPIRRLEDILDNIARIERFTAGMDFQAFVSNEQALYACLHALLIVSEAARKLGGEADAIVPGQPWTDIRSIGNILRHEYDGVDPEVIWSVVRGGDLLSLKQAIGGVLARLRDPEEPS